MVQGSQQLDTAELKSWCRAARSLIQTRHLPEIQYWLSTIATSPSMTRFSSSRGDASGPARASLHVSGASPAHSDLVSLRADLMDLQQQFLEILEAVSASGGLAKELDACEEARLTATTAASPPSEVCGASQLQGGHRVVRIPQYILLMLGSDRDELLSARVINQCGARGASLAGHASYARHACHAAKRLSRVVPLPPSEVFG
jgi:hypothetical protein